MMKYSQGGEEYPRCNTWRED